MFQPGFYKQGSNLLSIYSLGFGRLSVLDHYERRQYIWDSLPNDCEFLSHSYTSQEVQSFVKSNPQP